MEVLRIEEGIGGLWVVFACNIGTKEGFQEGLG